MDPDVAQTSSINTKCKTLDKIVETRRISTRNKKKTHAWGMMMIFYTKG